MNEGTKTNARRHYLDASVMYALVMVIFMAVGYRVLTTERVHEALLVGMEFMDDKTYQFLKYAEARIHSVDTQRLRQAIELADVGGIVTFFVSWFRTIQTSIVAVIPIRFIAADFRMGIYQEIFRTFRSALLGSDDGHPFARLAFALKLFQSIKSWFACAAQPNPRENDKGYWKRHFGPGSKFSKLMKEVWTLFSLAHLYMYFLYEQVNRVSRNAGMKNGQTVGFSTELEAIMILTVVFQVYAIPKTVWTLPGAFFSFVHDLFKRFLRHLRDVPRGLFRRYFSRERAGATCSYARGKNRKIRTYVLNPRTGRKVLEGSKTYESMFSNKPRARKPTKRRRGTERVQRRGVGPRKPERPVGPRAKRRA